MGTRKPFEFEGLPQALQPVVQQAIESELYEESLSQLEDLVHQQPQPGPDVLGALAWCVFEDAVTVMVDEVISAGERALELLAQARDAGADAAALKAYRAKVQRIVRTERKREQQILELLSRPVEDLDFGQVKDLALAVAERGGAENHRRAARLFQLAAQLAGDAGRDPNYYTCRVGMSLAHAGQWSEALPILRKMSRLELPLKDGLTDSYMLLAFGELLDYAVEREDREEFLALWDEAVATTAKVGKDVFPVARPVQDRLLKVALDWDLQPVCEHLAALFKERAPRTVSAEVRQLLEQAQEKYGIL